MAFKRKFEAHHVEALKKLAARGFGLAQAAERLGFSTTTIKKACVENDILLVSDVRENRDEFTSDYLKSINACFLTKPIVNNPNRLNAW